MIKDIEFCGRVVAPNDDGEMKEFALGKFIWIDDGGKTRTSYTLIDDPDNAPFDVKSEASLRKAADEELKKQIGAIDIEGETKERKEADKGLEKKIDEFKKQFDKVNVGELLSGEEITVDNKAMEAQKGAEIFNNYKGNKYEGALLEGEDGYPKEFAYLGRVYDKNIAIGLYTSAFGGATKSVGHFAFAGGCKNMSYGVATTTFGRNNEARARYSFVSGKDNKAYSNTGFTYGLENIVGNSGSLNEGSDDSYGVEAAFAGGKNSQALGSYSVALGKECVASGTGSVALGINAQAKNDNGAYALGKDVESMGNAALAIGISSKSKNEAAFAGGKGSEASGKYSFALGNRVKATGEGAVAFGGSDNEGDDNVDKIFTEARGKNSFAFGSGALAQGKDSFAFGYANTSAIGEGSFAMGGGSASGDKSIAIGTSAQTHKGHEMSFVCGLSVKSTAKHQLVSGRYNRLGDETLLHIVGNGVDVDNRSNAYTLDENGNGWFAGSLTAGSMVLRSSTEGSNKKFSLTVDDEGVVTVAEIEEV